MNEKARQAAITAVYDKLHENKLGAHWLWCVIEKIAAGESEEDAMREYGYYSRAALAAQPGAVGEPVTSVRVEGGMMRGATRRPGMASLPDGDHKLYAAAPTEAKPAQDAVDAVIPLDKDELAQLIAEHLGGTYHCTRVWEAWNVGTMSRYDFEPVDESETPTEIAEAIIDAIHAAISAKKGGAA